MPGLMQSPLRDPIAALAEAEGDCVLAVITGVEGPSYRPLGACMGILLGRKRVGSLSSGCVEADIALHAEEALAEGRPKTVLYGRGSPFLDIQLPCGGGLEILLLPRPDKDILRQLSRKLEARETCTLTIDRSAGELRISDEGATGKIGDLFNVRMLPEIAFYVFGKGPEASAFAALVQSAGFPNLLLSPDKETLDFGRNAGCATRHLKGKVFPADVRPDARSAVVLFFHDHEWEPVILKAALATEAFYIGAQGSQRARDTRLDEIADLGVDAADLARLKGPIGLIPSVRDARTLAVSVLAEILHDAMVCQEP